MPITPEREVELMRRAIELARTARARGDHPFGALIADADGAVLAEAMNTCGTTGDRTGHAERNLMTEASQRFSADDLADCTMFTSTEPCVMCSGATYWAGVGRVAFGMPEEGLRAMTGDDPENPTMSMPCRDVFAAGQRPTEVIGPIIRDEAASVHEGFWTPNVSAHDGLAR